MNNLTNEQKELKDYLHLYPEVYVHFNDEKEKVSTYGEFKSAFITGLFQNPAGAGMMAQLFVDDWEEPLDVMVTEFKPVLRPLSGMTEQEYDEIAAMQNDQLFTVMKPEFEFDIRIDTANTVYYLLSKHFDLFGLIDAGLAINKTLNTQP